MNWRPFKYPIKISSVRETELINIEFIKLKTIIRLNKFLSVLLSVTVIRGPFDLQRFYVKLSFLMENYKNDD